MAWQEGDGVWTVSQPDPGNCTIEPRLLIAGASEPDWSPAANAPGPRAGCVPARGSLVVVTLPGEAARSQRVRVK